MRLQPLFLVPDYGPGDGARPTADGPATDRAADGAEPGPVSEYRHYTDEQLLEERERRLRSAQDTDRPVELLRADHRRGAGTDDRIDQITDELMRRARQRHPSARGRAV
jgi:hypothetical protein